MCRPSAIDLGRAGSGRTLEDVVQVYSPDDEPFQITWIEATHEDIEVEDLDPGISRPVHRVRLRLKPGDKLGAVASSLRVTTDRPDSALLVVPVRAEILGPVSAAPMSLSMDKKDIGTPVRRTILIRPSNTVDRPVVEEIRVNPPWKLVEHHERALSAGLLACEVVLVFPEGSGNASGRMDIRVSQPSAELRIPLVIEGWTAPFPEASPEGKRP